MKRHDLERAYPQPDTSAIWSVIGASAVGTMIEWYDFYIFGSLAAFLTPVFYPHGDKFWTDIAFWATFATGFVVPAVRRDHLRPRRGPDRPQVTRSW